MENREETAFPAEPEESGTLYGRYFRCGHILRRRVGMRVSRLGLLKLLSERGSLTQRELRERLGIQAGSLSELAARLERCGLITRTPDPADRRRILVSLTERGQAEAAKTAADWDQELFCALLPEEREELGRLLGKVIDAHGAWLRERSLR